MQNWENKTPRELAECYRFWLNNFLTIGAYANYHGITDEEADCIIRLGRAAHECGL